MEYINKIPPKYLVPSGAILLGAARLFYLCVKLDKKI